MTFVISEGVQYKVRNIRFEGNRKLATEALREGLVLHSGQPFSDALRELDAGSLRSKYSQIGCIDIQIAPEPSFTDRPGVVDLVYKIEEGDQFLVGEIKIAGNARTRDKVIRREFVQSGLLPGEPLDGTRIETAKKRLGNLQYFVASPEMGKPIDIKIVNRRPPDQPYGEVAAPDLDAVVRTRLQSADDPPPIPPSPSAPVSVPGFGSEGAFEPQINEAPADPAIPAYRSPAPRPTSSPRRSPGGARRLPWARGSPSAPSRASRAATSTTSAPTARSRSRTARSPTSPPRSSRPPPAAGARSPTSPSGSTRRRRGASCWASAPRASAASAAT
jgi:outer membrane protein insertion porin family